MSYINTSTAVYVYINDVDVSEYLIEGSLSDDSAYTNQIITTTGQIVLGTTTSILDFDRSSFPIGSKVNIYVRLDNGNIAFHPKGTLYIINSTVNVEEQKLLLDVGCSLAFISDKEDSYLSAISGLYDDMLAEETKESFVVETRDLSNLSSLLEVEGAIIYQDQYGNIQKVNAFGVDGLGANIRPSKFTSFDKYSAISIESISETAIEPNVSAVIVETSVDIPGLDDPNDDMQGDRPNPLIQSETDRTIDTPWCIVQFGKIIQDTSSELTSESNPGCGSINDPNESASGKGSSYKFQGTLNISSYTARERVTSGKYADYTGPGNQVIREESWEYASASTWGQQAVSNSLNFYSNLYNTYASEANALLSKANQHFDARDGEEPTIGGEANPRYTYHHCNAITFYEQADKTASTARFWQQAAAWLPVGIVAIYNISSLNQTFNTFGSGGEVTQTITKSWVQRASLSYAQAVTGTVFIGGSTTLTSTGVLRGGPIPTGPINNPKDWGLTLGSESRKTFTYKPSYTIEVEEFTDYIDPKNSYKKTSYSSSGSTNSEQPDRFIDKTNINGQKYCNENKTDQRDLTITIPVLGGSPASSSEWFGDGIAYEKKISLPATFAPLIPLYDEVTDTCTAIDVKNKLLQYESILKNYGIIAAKKIGGDNRGFRVTEKLRAEIFEYYPFYPISISAESIGRAFSARAASSSWVFDTQNALCSIDCLLTGDIAQPVFADPSTKSVYIKTESTKVLTTSDIKLSSVTSSIQIRSLPEDGTLFLSGSPISIGDVIEVSDISSNLFSFVPSAAGTSEIDFSFAALDSADVELSSLVNIYPPVTFISIYPAIYIADGGEFTLNTTNDGLDCDGGDLDAGSTSGGPLYMEAGDFDTGTTVPMPPPLVPSTIPSGNNSIDPETEYGIQVKDNAEQFITTESLAVPEGQLDAVFDIFVQFDIKPEIVVSLITAIINNAGWDYGYFAVSFGTDIDMGTFIDPNDYDLDFGTFETANEPILTSSVV